MRSMEKASLDLAGGHLGTADGLVGFILGLVVRGGEEVVVVRTKQDVAALSPAAWTLSSVEWSWQGVCVSSASSFGSISWAL